MLEMRPHIGNFVAPIARLVPDSWVVPILTGPARGIRWQVGSGMMNFWLGTYEREKMALFAKHLRPDFVVYDIGANVGAYTVLAASRSREVHSFEPATMNLHYLHRNVSLNRLRNCTINPVAVGAKKGLVHFALGKDGFVGRVDPGGLLEVPCVSLDSYVSEHVAPDLIKMDIEGGEVNALDGARQLFASKRPVLFLATHDPKAHEFSMGFLGEHKYQITFLAEDEILALPS